jgi:HK97 family phage major capsid protein
MPSLREERLQEQVAEIRPQLAKAREITEKADAEKREMTAVEQKTFDEIMAKGREVSDAVKAHRHDQEVFAFAKELSDEVGLSGLGGELSGSSIESKGRRLSFKGMGSHVAARMMPDGTKALAPSGATIVGQEFIRDPVALGQVAQSLLDVLPTTTHTSPEYSYLRQTVRTNNAAAVATGAVKPELVFVTDKVIAPIVKVAAHTAVSHESIQDWNPFTSYVNSELMRNVIDAENTQGNGFHGLVSHHFVKPRANSQR